MTEQELKQLQITACKVRMGILMPPTEQKPDIREAAFPQRKCLPIFTSRK